ncbi:MAG: hypothetical protein ABI675_02685 [Chitinophagaceae bacterium]
MRYRFLLSVFFSAFSLMVQGQDSSATIGKVTISSPTAASLGMFGDIPVSYHTGLPNVTVPIYTIKSNLLQYPISLNYHGGGIKVQENASWVGAGWSLAASGVITRTVNGAPDDRGPTTGSFCEKGYYSDYGYHSYLWRYAPTGFGVAPDGYAADDFLFGPGKKDGEPDLYFFNFGSYSGKFYFNDDRTPVLVPATDLRIRPDYADGTGFSGFVITTPDGLQYSFGKTGNHGPVDPTEITVTGSLQYNYASATAAVSSWWLNKITSPDQTDSITFEYASESYSYHTLSTFPVSSVFVPYFGGPSNIEYNLVKNFVEGVRLSKINYSGGSVLFTPAPSPRLDLSGGYLDGGSLYDADNTEAKALGSITIRNNNGTLCKKDTFFYNYWHDTTSALTGVLNTTYSFADLHNDSYRLRLDSLQEISCDNVIKIPPHKFTYFSEFVPRRLSFGIDHWGFYNGVNDNQTLIPTVTVKTNTITTTTGANRDAAWPAMRAGALQKIDYPTGGYTLMDFEPHETWCEYDTFSVAPHTSRNAGYTSGTAIDTVTVSFSSNSHHLILSNAANGSGSARIDIFRTSDGGLAYGLSVNAGETKEEDFVVTAGTYLVKTTKNSPLVTGYGVSVAISEWIPHSISGNVIVGGLRIKTMTNGDSATQKVVSNYNYRVSQNPTGHSTSTLYSKPVYAQVVRNDVFRLVWTSQGNCSVHGCASCDGSTLVYLKSPSSLRPMATTQGSHIGYNEVFVSQPSNGYGVFRYYGSNYWDPITKDVCTRYIEATTCSSSIPNYPEAPLPFEPMRGELQYEGYFTDSGNIVKDVWHYPKYAQEGIPTPGMISSSIANLYTFTLYDLISYRKDRDSTEETVYIPPRHRIATGDEAIFSTVTNTAYCRSMFHHQPDKKIRLTSASDTLTTSTQYAFDFITPTCLITDSTAYYMNLLKTDTTNLLSEISTCSPQVAIGLSSCRYGVYQKYRRLISLDRLKLINYRRNNFSDSARMACLADRKTGADNILKPVIQLQEEFRNPPVEVTNVKNGKVLGSSFMLYTYSTNPSTKVYPWDNQLIKLKSPVTDFAEAGTTNSAILKDSRYTDEVSYRYLFGNIVAHNLKDKVLSYVWDYKQTLPVAMTAGAADTATAYTSFEADGSGYWTIGSSSRDTTQGITGKRCYQLSSGNITKSGLVDSLEYYVSYWKKDTVALSITGTQGSPHKGRTINGWTCFQHKITGVSLVTLSGTATIDELRLYPLSAQMITYTYDPALGITSQCDPRNDIIYYEYDLMGRLIYMRDKEGNIIKYINYQYQQQQ